MDKVALITGIRGQDGAYLAEFLLKKGYKVYGADRRSADSTNWRLKELGIDKEVEIVYMDLLELTNVIKTIEQVKPDEVYNLAAQSFVGVSFQQPILTSDVNALGVLRLLEAIRLFSPHVKFYQASTSELFGKVCEIPQTEKTPFYPRSPYGVAKLFGHWITVNYREAYNMFACSGILFNHESPLRGLEFVTRKITYGVARIRYGLQDKIFLGNLDAKRDWGYAKEYVEGMWLMLQQDSPGDYILATGETHSVKEFVECAFAVAGYNIYWEGEGLNTKGIDKKTGKIMIEISPKFYRPSEVDILIGNPKKAKEKLGWMPKTKFEDLVRIMVEADLNRVQRELK
ncbi:GDP-mannose 4,6-dehydratase [Thermosulfuriphilus ammonigenes]|uniref:GDP-mannose 4,6-dehydratase n=1 Tax=Thermosulfuriphilus ammonigenes TaxID=1936021 RepID=A0A6G7PXE9_9BACT|nr:GDP-mannose 4,6-dehydratase [Thermosulfuriphilus ammonigenes]MBA2849529.1 GDPmannose 4,6-dehydratase [Thermosulfuriphilus ammonigenes]QIJ72364.1 GDP-mannose 4,6-dehydratase [Thermosulfuriphilus ammonigenes]